LIDGCWLLIDGCWLLIGGCWLLTVGCWLLACVEHTEPFSWLGVFLFIWFFLLVGLVDWGG
jgi:hypothetical protein